MDCLDASSELKRFCSLDLGSGYSDWLLSRLVQTLWAVMWARRAQKRLTMAERWQVGMVLWRPELPKSPWREILVTEPRKREGPRMELQCRST